MIGLIIILFNTDRFLAKQYELFTKHIYGQFIIVDNSTDTSVSARVRKFCGDRNIRYIKTGFIEGDSSRSHGMACNHAYELLQKEYEILGFFDHDLFPVRGLDIPELMKDKAIAGVPQVKKQVMYFWAGLVILNNEIIDKAAVDFMPSPGLDTGGEIYRIVKHLPEDKYHLFAERPFDDVTRIYFDHETKEPMFIHFRNGSNWANEEGYADRMDMLMGSL